MLGRTLCLASLAALAIAAPAAAAGDPTMPLSQVHRGQRCTARTVIHGTTISTFDVEVRDVVDGQGEDPRILIRASGPAVDQTGVGEGFSGSPIYCPDGHGVQRVIGAISEGIGQYGNTEVLATPIGQILGQPVRPPAGARHDARLLRSARPLATPLWAFGHPFDETGRRSLLLQDAYVYDVVANPGAEPDFASYKLAAAGHDRGTLTSDGPDAVAGRVGRRPSLIPVTVRVHDRDTGRTQVSRTQVADETDVGNPDGFSPISLVAPTAIAQASSAIFQGEPARETGNLCLRIWLRESARPAHFCNRYEGSSSAGLLGELASSDSSDAISLIDGATFARLHVRRITARLNVGRGIAQAFILSARAPRHRVHAGRRIRIVLHLRRFQGRRLRRVTGYRIPRGLRSGVYRLAIAGTPADDEGGDFFGFFVDILSGDGFGSFGGGAAGPQSVRAVVRAIDAIHRYDGVSALLEAASGRRAGPPRPRNLLRDPRIRISGQATVRLRVIGRRSRRPAHRWRHAGRIPPSVPASPSNPPPRRGA